MDLRLISGIYGGRKIDAPGGTKTHPMSERVRNALFNSIGSEIVGASILDVFAGSGSVGLEALSRGAKQATFVEKDRLAQNVLAKNVTSLSAEEQATIVRSSVKAWLGTVDGEFDVIFADPPYGDMQLSTVSELFGLLKIGGLMILSHPGRGEIPTKTGVVVVDNRSYGNAYLTFYRRVE